MRTVKLINRSWEPDIWINMSRGINYPEMREGAGCGSGSSRGFNSYMHGSQGSCCGIEPGSWVELKEIYNEL